MPSLDNPLQKCPLCGETRCVAGDDIEGFPGSLFLNPSKETIKCERFYLCPTCGMFWSHLDPTDLVADGAPMEELIREPVNRESTQQRRAVTSLRLKFIGILIVAMLPLLVLQPLGFAMLLGVMTVFGTVIWLINKFRGARMLPPKPEKFVLPEAIREFKKWENAIVPLVGLTIWCLCAAILGTLFDAVLGKLFTTSDTVHLVRTPIPVVYVLAAGASLLPAAWFTRRALGWLMGRRFESYEYMCAVKNRVQERVLQTIFVCLTVIAVLLLELSLDHYTRFDPTGVRINGFWTLGSRSFTYEDIKELRAVTSFTAPNGKHVERPHFSIHFVDGTRWRTLHFHDTDPVADEKLFDFLREQTGLEIREVAHDDDP